MKRSTHWVDGGYIASTGAQTYPHDRIGACGAGRADLRHEQKRIEGTCDTREVTCRKCLAFIERCRQPGNFLGHPDLRPRAA